MRVRQEQGVGDMTRGVKVKGNLQSGKNEILKSLSIYKIASIPGIPCYPPMIDTNTHMPLCFLTY